MWPWAPATAAHTRQTGGLAQVDRKAGSNEDAAIPSYTRQTGGLAQADRNAGSDEDAGIPRCVKGFFSHSQLSVQTLLWCP